MFNFLQGKKNNTTANKAPVVKVFQPKPGQSMEDAMAEIQAEHGGNMMQGNLEDLFKVMGKDALTTLKNNGVDVDELISSGIIDPSNIPS